MIEIEEELSDEQAKKVLQTFQMNKRIKEIAPHNNVYMRFSDVGKYKINPEYGYTFTPRGYYGFPVFSNTDLKKVLYDEVTGAFARKSRYLIFFTVKGSVLKISKYNEKDLEADVLKLIGHDPKTKSDWSDAIGKYRDYYRSLGDYVTFHKLVYNAASRSYQSRKLKLGFAEIWRKILIKCGYDAVLDDVGNVFTNDIYKQICVLRNEAIVPLGRFKNPVYVDPNSYDPYGDRSL